MDYIQPGNIQETFGRTAMKDIASHTANAILFLNLGAIPADCATSPASRDYARGMMLEACALGREDLAHYVSARAGVRLDDKPANAEAPAYKFQDVLSVAGRTFRNLARSYAMFL